MNPDFLVSFPGLGIKNLPISRQAFSIFGMPIYWYGLLIAVALILCMLLAMRHASAYQLKSDDVLDTFIAVIPLMIIFARLYYVVLEWDSFKDDILSIVDTRRGGLAFYGGVIGGALGILLVTRLKKSRFPACWIFGGLCAARTGDRSLGQFFQSGGLWQQHHVAMGHDQQSDHSLSAKRPHSRC